MTNFKTEKERIEKGIKKINELQLSQHAEQYISFKARLSQLAQDKKMVEEAINRLGGEIISKNLTKEGILNVLVKLKQELGIGEKE